MKRRVVIVAALVAASVLCPSADARSTRKSIDPRLAATSIGVGAAATATYFGLGGWRWSDWDINRNGVTKFGAWAATTIGCMAVAPMVGSLVVQRPLGLREAQILTASCVVPIVGGWLVNKAWNVHPEWRRYEPQPVVLHDRNP